MTTAIKLAVTGDINGQFKDFFTKLTGIQSKQSFAFVVVAGNFFKSDIKDVAEFDEEAQDLVNGKIQVPLPVYFTLGSQTLPEDIINILDANNGELCSNVFALGRRGQAKTTEGIEIVAVSGRHVDTSLDRPSSVFASGYTDGDAVASCSYGKADVLVTSDWPEDIERGCRTLCAGPQTTQRACIADLNTALKPRYHFSTSLAFYERQPFFHNAANWPITRFIALAPFGNALREKWIYAFSVEPSAAPSGEVGPEVTVSPLRSFTSNNKRKLESQQEAFNGYRFSNGDTQQQGARRPPKRQKLKGAVMPESCFFCLSNPTCEAHMIGSIGNEAYVTIAKGPLPTRDYYPDLGFSGHMLIVPLVHAPRVAAIPGDQGATFFEMLQYREALQLMVALTSKDSEGRAKLGAVTWEISRSGGVHNHWQFLPVPVELVNNGSIEAAFKAEAEALDYPAFLMEKAQVAEVIEGNCFILEIWSPDATTTLALQIDQSYRFDLQFPRQVMAMLLGLKNRGVWKDCPQEKDEEEHDVARFKEIFKPFDFTLKE